MAAIQSLEVELFRLGTRMKTPELSVRLAYCHSNSSTKSEKLSRVYQSNPGPPTDSRMSYTWRKLPLPDICQSAKLPAYSGLKRGKGAGANAATTAALVRRASVRPVKDGLAEPTVGNKA